MKYITVLLFCALGFASSCSNMLDQYSHSAIPPEAVTEKDLPALRLGMYNRVQSEPQTRSFIMCDILGGDITQSNYNPIDVINSTLSPLNSAIVTACLRFGFRRIARDTARWIAAGYEIDSTASNGSSNATNRRKIPGLYLAKNSWQ